MHKYMVTLEGRILVRHIFYKHEDCKEFAEEMRQAGYTVYVERTPF